MFWRQKKFLKEQNWHIYCQIFTGKIRNHLSNGQMFVDVMIRKSNCVWNLLTREKTDSSGRRKQTWDDLSGVISLIKWLFFLKTVVGKCFRPNQMSASGFDLYYLSQRVTEGNLRHELRSFIPSFICRPFNPLQGGRDLNSIPECTGWKARQSFRITHTGCWSHPAQWDRLESDDD